MKEILDYVHRYRGYWSDGGKCRIQIYQEDGHDPVVICSQLPDNGNTSVTKIAEYLAAEAVEEHDPPVPVVWIEHRLHEATDGRQETFGLVALEAAFS